MNWRYRNVGVGNKGSGNNQKYTNVGEAVKDAMAMRGFTQEMLGRQLYSLGDDDEDENVKRYAQSSVAERLRKADMKVGTLVEILNIIGCDLVIVDRNRGSGNKWKIKGITEEEYMSGRRTRVRRQTEEE